MYPDKDELKAISASIFLKNLLGGANMLYLYLKLNQQQNFYVSVSKKRQ